MFNQPSGKINKMSVFIGAVHDIYNRLALYIGAANTVMVSAVFYTNVIKPIPALAWLTLPLFALFGLAASLLGVVFIWRVIIPTGQAYSNYMSYKHDNLIRRDLEKILSHIESKNGGNL